MSNYKPYPSCKDSGVERIGEVPEHWDVMAFKRLASIRNGQEFKGVADPNGNYPVFGSGGEFARASSYIFNGESVLLGRKGTVDKPLYVSGPFWTVDTMFYTEIADKAFPKFVYYCALTIPFSLYSTNTALPSMTGEDISSHVLAAPKYAEQQAIAAAIDRETARIDALIAKKTRFVELLREKIVAMASQPFDSPNIRWVRLSHVCDVISRPVLQQPGCSYTKLGLFNRGRGIFKRDETDAEDMGDSEFFWVQPSDLILSGQFAWEGAVALANEDHDECVVSHRFPVIRGRAQEALTEYLFAYFLTSHGNFVLNDCSRGSAGRNRPLNMNLLLGSKIPIPSMQIQLQITQLVRLERQIGRTVNRSIDLLRERRSAFITAAVTGKIDLRDDLLSASEVKEQ